MKKLIVVFIVCIIVFVNIMPGYVINGYTDIAIVSTQTASIASNYLRFWADYTNGDIECVTFAGAPCYFKSNPSGTSSRHVCLIENDTQSATALSASNFSGMCEVPTAATIIEVNLVGGTGVVGSQTLTGTSSVQIKTLNGGATILSGALATVSGKSCARTTTSATCLDGTTSSSSISIASTSITQGDRLYVSASTADGVQTFFNVAVVYTY